MRFAHTYIKAALLVVCLAPVAESREYSLVDLYRSALRESERIELAREEITFSELGKNRAASALMPRITGFSSYQKFSEEKSNTEHIILQTPQLSMDYPSTVLVQPDSALVWGARADESLSLSLRELTLVSEAKNNIRRAEQDLAFTKEIHLFQVFLAYFNVLKAKKGVEITQSNKERITKYLEAAKARLKVGEVTKTVLLRAESELSGAKSDQVRAENALVLARSELVRLTGIEPDFTLKEEQIRDKGVESLAELKHTAYSERADLKSLEYQVKMAKQEVSYARGAFWPTISIAAVYQKADQEPESVTLNDESIYGSVTLSFPFFEGGQRVAEVRQAKTRERQAVLRYEDQKKTVGMDVESAYLDFMTRKGMLKYLEDQLAFAQENYRGVSRQFELGLASSIDVIDANNLLVASERQLSDAFYSYQISILAMERAVGIFMKDVNTKTRR